MTTAAPVRPPKGARITGDARATLVAEIRELYAHHSMREIAERVGRSYGFVHRVLSEESDVRIRGRGGYRARGRNTS